MAILDVVSESFQADLGPATVVTLYLTRDLNLRLRPKLLQELRPGARIVSHNFDMKGYKPKKTVQVDVNGRTHTVYLWVTPLEEEK